MGESYMKVWIYMDRDRDMNIIDVKVYKNKPDWDLDFYESAKEYEVLEE